MTIFDLITRSQAIRVEILHHLYQARLAQPTAPWVWRRDLEEVAGGPIAFEAGYLVERGHIIQDGPRYRITTQGIDQVEGGLKASA